MADRSSAVVSGLMFFSFLVLNGCAPPAAVKPEVSSPSPKTAARADGKEKPGKVARESKAPSSLEALRRGEFQGPPPQVPSKKSILTLTAMICVRMPGRPLRPMPIG